MGMTREEKYGKAVVESTLMSSGYDPYADIFHNYDLNLTDDPGVIAYMVPSEGRIVVNRALDLDLVSVVVRHEILHFFLEHEARMLDKLAQESHIPFIDAAQASVDDLANLNYLKRLLYSDNLFNYAADYEISNLGYDKEDLIALRNFVMNGKKLKLLITEDDHPDWVDLSLEEMYDKLREEREKESEQAEDDIENNEDSSDSNSNSSESGEESNSGSESEGDEESNDNSGSNELDKEGENSNGSESGSESNSSENIGDSESEGDEESTNNTRSAGQRQKSEDDDDGPQIGDRGSKEIQKQEEAEREATIEEEAKDGEPTESEEEKEARLQRIEDDLNNREKAASTVQNSKEKTAEKRKLNMKQAQLNSGNYSYNSSALRKFEKDINAFIGNIINAEEEANSYHHLNQRAYSRGSIKPGRIWDERKKVPYIYVFYDQSTSFDSDDIQVCDRALENLHKWEKEGKLKLEIYYFANHVGTSNNRDVIGGGTGAGKELIDTIQALKAENVIILTDNDFDKDHWNQIDSAPNIRIKGGLWILFRGSESKKLWNHISATHKKKYIL